MSLKMKNAPVYFALVQVRFNPILSLDTYVSSIQENLRKAGYPDFKKSVSMSFNLAPAGLGDSPTNQAPQIQQVARFIFSNMENTQGFVLEQNALTFQTTEYTVFGDFLGQLLMGIDLINKVVGLSYIERIGLRYLDAIAPREAEKIDLYLAPQFLGMYGQLDGSFVHSFSESLIHTPIGFVMSRAIIANGNLGFPPDLQGLDIPLASRFKQVTGVHAIIDTDGFYEAREAYNFESIKNKLNALHDKITDSFKAAVTKYALSVWE